MQVVDASAAVSGLVDSGPTGEWCAERMLEDDLVAPHLMPFEAANIIRRTVARGDLDPSEGAQGLHDLDQLAVEYLPFTALDQRAWALRENLTVYDASYVAATELCGGRLVTLDRRLAKAPGLHCDVIVAPT